VLLELGTRVRTTDGDAGELEDVVIDPVGKRVTHLVVRPRRHGQARLVSIEGAYAGRGRGEVMLPCTRAEFVALPSVDEFAYVRLGEATVADPEWDVGVKDVLALPYYDSTGMFETAVLEQNVGVAYNRVPKGEVELRRSSPVLAVDGRYVGRVGGLILDDDEEITQFLLEQGHLWTRREVTVPMSAVEDVQTDAVRISLSESELAELPVRRAHRWFLFRRS
jgi:sporulation protein YlmC with PRC-barrel domain